MANLVNTRNVAPSRPPSWQAQPAHWFGVRHARQQRHGTPGSLVCHSDPRARTRWYGVYTDEQYQAQRQAEERAKWAENVRSLTAGRDHHEWAADGAALLDPPALLGGVTVVIISPRKPVTVGTVARACGSFECQDLRIVMPRQESYITRHAKSASKGAQYILYSAGHYDSIQEATADCDVRVAFTRWAQSSSPHVAKVDISSLMAHPAVQRVITAPLDALPGPRPPPSAPWTDAAAAAAEAAEAELAAAARGGRSGGRAGGGSAAESTAGSSSGSDEEEEAGGAAGARAAAQPQPSSSAHGSGGSAPAGAAGGQRQQATHGSPGAALPAHRPPKVALVFGREELGMSDAEVDECEVCCSVPLGRLQESLSLSHAVSIALCALFQSRLQHLASTSTAGAQEGSSGSGGGEEAGKPAGTGAMGGGGAASYTVDASTGMVRRLVAP